MATKARWRKLENAAKIFPATSTRRDERVFRFACELKENIDGEILQRALDKTIMDYKMFRCVLRKGFFWFYFEEKDIRPMVKEEDEIPCNRLYIRDKKSLLFRVSYYNKRINFEVFHALTDGTGALEFLKSLVFYYLKECHPDKIKGTSCTYDATDIDKEEDGFYKYYDRVDKSIKIPKYKAYQLRGRKLESRKLNIFEGNLSVREVLNKSKEYNTTMTVYLTSVFMLAIGKEIMPRTKNKTVALMVPVNLRKFFPSSSARNFFGWIEVGYDFNEGYELADIISYVDDFFKREITKERMAARMNELVKIEKNFLARAIPLEIKTIGLRIGAHSSGSDITAVISNIGKIVMPEECNEYINMFDIFTSTPKVEICVCSYEDVLTVSVTSAYESTNVERNFFRILSGEGLDITLGARV